MAAKKSHEFERIEWEERSVPVADLIPYERNPRTISKKAFEKLKESLRDMGYHQRIIAQPDLKVIGGHQRIRALQEIGVKVIKILVPNRELTLEEFRRILIQDNLPFGEFDFDILSADYDREELASFGMPETLLDNIGEMGEEGLTDADAVPDLQPVITAKEGQIWLLGDHRLACGDSTNSSIVEALLSGCASPPP